MLLLLLLLAGLRECSLWRPSSINRWFSACRATTTVVPGIFIPFGTLLLLVSICVFVVAVSRLAVAAHRVNLLASLLTVIVAARAVRSAAVRGLTAIRR